MNSPRITFTYAPNDGIIDHWWVRLEQEDIPDDTATQTDAAELLDTLYNLDACNPEEYPEEPADPTPEELEDKVEVVVGEVACLYDADGNIDTVVRVIRSRQDAPYKLRLQGGALVSTETVRESITLTPLVEDASSIVLDYPVISGFSARWSGPVYTAADGWVTAPPILRVGNTLHFGGVSVASGTISATYLTEYDRCTVTILGVDGEAGECTARVFFHGLVDELDLEIPEASTEIGTCTKRWLAKPTEYEIECYQQVTISTRCSCSEDEVDSHTRDEVVDCPEQVVRCPGNDTKCRHLVGSITVPEYVECVGDNEITGRPGMIYSLSTREYFEEHCCKAPSFELPQCPEKTATHRGGIPLQGGAGQYYRAYGPKLRIVPVSPPGGICGNWTIRQEIRSSDCCDGVPPLVWDTAISPAVITPNSSNVIAVTGGRGPYTWTVVGSGFQYPGGSTRGVSTGPQILLSALPLACGIAEVTVTDGCSTITWYIRCTAGQWVMVTAGAVTAAAAKAIIGNISIEADVSESSHLGLIGYTGRYKVKQVWSYVGNGSSSSCGYWCSTCIDTAFVPGAGVCVWSLDKSLLEVPGDAGYGPLRGNSAREGNGSCIGNYVVMSKVLQPCSSGGACYSTPPYHNAYIAHGPRPWDGAYTNTTVWEWQC